MPYFATTSKRSCKSYVSRELRVIRSSACAPNNPGLFTVRAPQISRATASCRKIRWRGPNAKAFGPQLAQDLLQQKHRCPLIGGRSLRMMPAFGRSCPEPAKRRASVPGCGESCPGNPTVHFGGQQAKERRVDRSRRGRELDPAASCRRFRARHGGPVRTPIAEVKVHHLRISRDR